MRPYGMKKRGNKLHPRNECGICSAHPVTKGQARMAIKKELKERITEWQGASLQNQIHWFKSNCVLIMTYSSTVEQGAVNSQVLGSNPSKPAIGRLNYLVVVLT